MAMGTTANLPNYVGELFSITPQDTPFLSAIGGLTGGESVKTTRFGWQDYSLRAPESNRQRLEGANAPAAEYVPRNGFYNVVEIHHERVTVSYTKQAAVNLIDHAGQGGGVEGSNPVTNELQWQIDKALTNIARDLEVTFLYGTFNDPADGTAATRSTRGLAEAIATNHVVAADEDGTGTGGGPDTIALDMDDINDVAQMAWDNGGLAQGDSATIMLGSVQKRALTRAAVDAGLAPPQSRDVAGVHVTTVETDFGVFNVMLNRHVNNSDLFVVSLEECAPVFLQIPGKGFLFVEPLAKTGSAEDHQIYGEVGLRFGNELKHGRISGLPTSL